MTGREESKEGDAERIAREEEEQRRKQREEERQRRIKEQAEAEERYRWQLECQRMREEQQPVTQAAWNMMVDGANAHLDNYRTQLWWTRYLRMTGEPNPLNQAEVNAVLSTHLPKMRSLKNAVTKNEPFHKIIDDIYFASDLFSDASYNLKQAWPEQIMLLENLIEANIRLSTFKVLLGASAKLDLQTGNLQYVDQQNKVSLFLWGNFTKNPKNRSFEFPEGNLSFDLPKLMVVMDCVFQLRHTDYDHLSHYCTTYWPSGDSFSLPAEPFVVKPVLYTEEELTTGASVGVQTVTQSKEGLKDLASRTSKDTLDESTSALEGADDLEEDMEEEEGDLNLQEVVVLGGVWHIALLAVPPQATKVENWRVVQEVPQVLIETDYEFQFNPPAPPTPSKSGAKKKPDSEDAEKDAQLLLQEYQKLVFISLKLPEHILWLDSQQIPLIARWDKRKNVWTTTEFYDTKYDEDKRIYTFRMAALAPVAFLQSKYTLIPYLGWSLTPAGPETCKLAIQTSALQAEFTIQNHQCVLTHLGSNGHKFLQHLYNVPMTPTRLLKEMQQWGVNFYPETDSYKYLKSDSVKPKDWTMEENLYQSMGLICPSYDMGSSRWNSTVGNRRAVIKLREHIVQKVKGPQYLVMCSLRQACVLKVFETSQEFSEEEMPGQDFYCDFYQLILASGSEEGKAAVAEGSSAVKYGVYQMLLCVKPVTYTH